MGLYKRKKGKEGKGGQIFWMTYTANGRRVYESTKTTNKKLAEKIYAKRITEVIEGNWFGTERKKTLREMIERYENEYVSKSKYQSRDKSIFKQLKAYFGENILLKDIENHIEGYENYRAADVMPATIVKELALLRRMFNIAVRRWEWAKDNPVSFCEMPRVTNERTRYLTEKEYERLLNVLNDETSPRWLKPIVIMALNSGLRESNLLNMRWSWVNLFSSLIVIDGKEMKNDKSIGIPLTQEAIETLRDLQKVKQIEDFVFHDNGKSIYPVKLQRAFRKACEVAEIENFRFHDLRHTFASYLRQNGVDLHTISRLLGHKDVRMTQRYAHLSVENLRDAISVLDRSKSYSSVTFEGAR